jgi:hypothetical protein
MVSFSLSYLKRNLLGNIRNNVLAGMVVALALIPEAIAFSIIAGVAPKVGLYASLHKPLFIVSSIIRPIKRFLIAYDGKASVRKAIELYRRSTFAGQGIRVSLAGGGTQER